VTTLFLFVLLFVFMLVGVPVAVAVGLSSMLTILFFGHDSLASLTLKLFETSEHFTLLAIPFFILGGAFMTTGGVAKRMIRFAVACIGHLRGGLAMASVLACMLFAAVSGSSPATVVAVGSIVIAGMVRAGYPQTFAAGVICNAGTLGILIPPSIVMVVYGAVTETSVGKLFIAGIIPGILLGLMLMAAIYVRARIVDLPRQPRATLREVLVAGRESLWGLLLLVIILGGIYGGIFTPTEAAAVSAVYAFVIAVFVYRDIGLKDVPRERALTQKSNDGSQSAICGTYVTNTRNTSSTESHGTASRTTSITDMPVMPAVTNRFSPTGGVTIPISRFTVMMMPRCTGSMPSLVAIGNRIGARIRMMPVGSMKQPAISSRTLTTIRNTHGCMPQPMIASAMTCGIRSVVST
jgi:TRAP-type uncharacterized transport system fused permease subunit